MKIRDLFAKLFVTERYFTIGIRERGNRSITENPMFVPRFIVPSTGRKWCADPMLVDADGKTWLFYEAVLDGHGHIEAAQVLDGCTLGKPMTVLWDGCHYSYPFVFRHGESWYMIPESSAASEVRLYRAVDFPEKWEQVTVLLKERAVDTTVFEKDGKMYLLTFLPDAATERVTPRAYRMELFGETASLTPVSWECRDGLRVRGAGPVFEEGKELYRPAQISREQCYGDGLVFYRIDDPEGYSETAVSEMGPKDLKLGGCCGDGLHTYSRSERFEAIDIRSGTVDYFKPVKRLLKR